MAANPALQEQIRQLPHRPGVYKYFGEEDTIIYVGKAIDLRKRVSSYFTKQDHNKKTQQLVKNIRRIEFTIVDSESDAFLLENNLIKQHQPKYNILLKDGKTYPYLLLTNERFPRLIPTRNKVPGQGRYYGPYANVTGMNLLLELIRALYPLRTCTYNLSPQNIEAGKFKVCLEYHLGNCKGPCEGLQDEETYNQYIQQIRLILNGDLRLPKQYFREKMTVAAQEQQYELAHQFKQKLDRLDEFQSKSTIVNASLSNIDVFSIASNEKSAFINYLKVMNGSIILTQSVEVQKKLDEPDDEILAPVIMQMREEFESQSKEILTNVAIPSLPLPGVNIAQPQIGDKRKLLELSIKNVLYLRKEKESMNDRSKDLNEVRIMETMKKDLRLTELPKHIECFDNSNFQGDNPVAAMVCFRNAKPSKKDYRHFHIKTVVGPNDFDSMYEIVTRRYRRLLDEGASLPQLVIVDGGKGQLSMGVKALKDLGLWGQIPIIGIAKRLEEIYVPNDPLPLYIDKKSETLRLIQRMRDEAHRFGITFHRSRRDAATLKTELTDVKGLGPVTADKLLTKFKSVKKIKELSEAELVTEVGKAKARILLDYFSQPDALG
ncbi:excinuclease ABC subunit C [Hymenobacter lutimineralis]|uniref:UvrABC system protein C n=1 Tax=Hymenobacter lutimineralis TaxID=2606448 RepID=A0A5D6VCF6_9BACT|nr:MULTISPECIES: excinuclease ABC subunit UvrC [Hymenobacter]QIX61955.1 excinuclease ABC subunit C [Hymenobacter sp. BT18]TYZ12538.1 excinuclease ABC subunit C [Hymenobacter lutimineralis]